jgi:ribokinase
VGRVVVVGSVNVDFVVRGPRLPAPGETVVGGAFSRHDGGKGANQAVASARLGARTVFVGAVGDDELGSEALAALEREGIDVAFTERVPGVAPGVALILVGAAGENLIGVAPGANAAVGSAVVERAFERLGVDAEDVVLVSNEIAPDGVAAALAAGRFAGAVTVLNPAPASGLGPAALRAATIVTPNRGELAVLVGGEADADGGGVDVAGAVAAASAEASARLLLGRGDRPEAIVVTLGADGALLVQGSDATRVPAVPVDAVDATGAGDAFNGCLAAALAERRSLDDAVRRAVVAGGLATTRPGARAGMPTTTQLAAALGPDVGGWPGG